MLFCQLARAKSLREICKGLAGMLGKLSHLGLPSAPPKSTLSHANANRTSELFKKFGFSLLDNFRDSGKLFRNRKFRFDAPVKILDSTMISLCHSAYEWAVYRTGKGAAKMHVLLDATDVMPDFVHITEGRAHDLVVRDLLRVRKGTIVVFDRGYNSLGFYDDLTYRGVHFVTRMRSNAVYEVIKENSVPYSINHRISRDQVIRITGSGYYFRRIVSIDQETGEEIALLTNLLRFGPTTISNTYRARWDIEEFFRQIKQNLHIRTFAGTSKNAFEIQIWTAMIALLILSWLSHRSRSGWSFSVLAAIVRFILLSNTDLEGWLNDPEDKSLRSSQFDQLSLAFS